jgi:plasmid replication initiation protein
LDQLRDRERNRLTAIEDIADAGKALYATLTTEQRAIADRKLVLPIRPVATGVVLPGTGDAGRASGSVRP